MIDQKISAILLKKMLKKVPINTYVSGKTSFFNTQSVRNNLFFIIKLKKSSKAIPLKVNIFDYPLKCTNVRGFSINILEKKIIIKFYDKR